MVVIGDGFDPVASEFALQLAATRRDVRSIVVTSFDERDFALRSAFEFVDPESGARIETDAAQAREGFIRRFAAARLVLARRLAAGGVRHVEHVLDEPLDQPLRAALGAGGSVAAR